MSINEKSIVGESFEDLSAADMAMLTGRNDDGVAPASRRRRCRSRFPF